jgi:hypothetical protein
MSPSNSISICVMLVHTASNMWKSSSLQATILKKQWGGGRIHSACGSVLPANVEVILQGKVKEVGKN